MRIETLAWEAAPGGRLPERPLFAIGDIHGYSDALARLLEHLSKHISESYPDEDVDLVYLGDLIDRGPDPVGALDLVGRGIGLDNVYETALMGNHDYYLAAAAGLSESGLAESEVAAWLTWGGSETLTAMNVEPYDAPEMYQAALGIAPAAALSNMRLSFQTGEVLCVHAGVDPRQPLSAQRRRDLMWIREPFLSAAASEDDVWPFDLTVVHGHTPDAHGIFANRIGVDSGGYATNVFTALEMSERGARFHYVIRA